MLDPNRYTVEHLSPLSAEEMMRQQHDWQAGIRAGLGKGHERKDRKRPAIGSAAELRRKEFPPIRYVVPGYIGEGCTLLAGRPKLGKSWLMLDVGLAVAAGRICLGETQCEKGEVLYLALEDNERRLQCRIDK